MRITTVVGARPQFVKAAMVSLALAKHTGIRETLIHTGQHYDREMSAVFFDDLGLAPPAVNLSIGSGSHGAQTGHMLEALEKILLADRPDMVLVYGDTNSTLAAALAAAKLVVPVAHVEAGMRCFNRSVPEEVNRIVTDHLSAVLYAASPSSAGNLACEGIAGPHVVLAGDVMYDAALLFAGRAGDGIRRRLGLETKGYALATIHRAENTDDPANLAAVFGGLVALAAKLPVVVPLHPRTRAALGANGMGDDLARRLRLIDPVGYVDMQALEAGARLVVTDSGGVQKEAFYHRVPCVTLRGETEWVELVELGWNRLLKPRDADLVGAALIAALDAPAGQEAPELYGAGRAAAIVAGDLAVR